MSGPDTAGPSPFEARCTARCAVQLTPQGDGNRINARCLHTVIASEAIQTLTAEAFWIASSQRLLAMTRG